jgi:hypothetical protein
MAIAVLSGAVIGFTLGVATMCLMFMSKPLPDSERK